MRRVERIGKKFNKLTVLGKKREKGHTYYYCRCECDNKVWVRDDCLISGKTKSCGCLQEGNIRKAFEKNIEKNIVNNTNLAMIRRKKLIASNASGVTGVRWDKISDKWAVEIQFKKKRYFLGRYEDKGKAIQVRKTAEEKLFGKFLKDYNDFLITEAEYCIRVFEMVLSGTYIRFPRWFWKDISSTQLKGLLKYFFEIKLKWTIEEIKEKINRHIFIKYKLKGMLKTFFSDGVFKAIDFIYPNEIKEWELAWTPRNYWNVNTGRQAVKWMIEEKLKWDEDDIKDKLTISTFEQYRLFGMLEMVFDNNAYKAINTTYPGKFKREDFRHLKHYKDK